MIESAKQQADPRLLRATLARFIFILMVSMGTAAVNVVEPFNFIPDSESSESKPIEKDAESKLLRSRRRVSYRSCVRRTLCRSDSMQVCQLPDTEIPLISHCPFNSPENASRNGFGGPLRT